MNKRWIFGLSVSGLMLAAGLAWAANSACNIDNCMEQGGGRFSVGGSLDILTGGDLDIETGGVLKVAGSDVTPELLILDGVTASTADLNATTNFEETISATTSEVTIAAAKTFDVPAGNLQIANVAITASAVEINQAADNSVNTEVVAAASVAGADLELAGHAVLSLHSA